MTLRTKTSVALAILLAAWVTAAHAETFPGAPPTPANMGNGKPERAPQEPSGADSTEGGASSPTMPAHMPRPAMPPPRSGPLVAGSYDSDSGAVVIEAIAADSLSVRGGGWNALGRFDGRLFEGKRFSVHPGRPDSLIDSLRFVARTDSTIEALVGHVPAHYHRERWKPAPAHVMVGEHVQAGAVTTSDSLPKFGEYVTVEELPEAITKVDPVYPADARAAGVDGTVMVQALVGADGRVGETKIVKSIPMLDQAAIDAVKQWIFKPGLNGGKPVAVWVAVPVKFGDSHPLPPAHAK